ncbi:MAG: hypothetical protein LR015_10505 [Verrucomicrobia bacterium]|nr:hypothetical protein [Verrucomicrobiota bacterium]
MNTGQLLGWVQSHLDRQFQCGCDVYGADHNRMLMSSLDVLAGAPPENSSRPAHIPKRVYRNIDAPRGCALYWDQPLLRAALDCGSILGKDNYLHAVHGYVGDYIDRCTASNGIILWGNHYYWDAYRDQVLKFVNEEPPTPTTADESGNYHELRPLFPEWDILYEARPEAIKRHIRAMLRGHLLNAETGEFNRHADAAKPQWQMHAFIESGGVLIDAISWLYAKEDDKQLLQVADAMAAYSYRHRGCGGLLCNCPNSPSDRWDRHVATSETGIWAQGLLTASDRVPEPFCSQWRGMAESVMIAYLRHAWDGTNGAYWGKIHLATGLPVRGTPEGCQGSVFMPDDHCNLWEPLFPRHDYPMSFAMVCADLFERTGNPVFKQGCERWLRQIDGSMPGRSGLGGYAEHYGRILLFLQRCEKLFPDNSGYSETLIRVRTEALNVLWQGGMFRTHPGEHRYDSVDGLGFLLSALLY